MSGGNVWIVNDLTDVREAILATAVRASWELAYTVVDAAAVQPVQDVDVFHDTVEHWAVVIAYLAINTQ